MADNRLTIEDHLETLRVYEENDSVAARAAGDALSRGDYRGALYNTPVMAASALSMAVPLFGMGGAIKPVNTAIDAISPPTRGAPQIAEGPIAPDTSTYRGRLQVQGGALRSKPNLERIARALEDHGFEWEWAEDGIRAYAEVHHPKKGWYKQPKTFKENTSLKTLRDWLGY